MRIKDYQENNLYKEIIDNDLETINNNIEQKTVQIIKTINQEEQNDLLLLEREL